jgi:hypothetical protein
MARKAKSETKKIKRLLRVSLTQAELLAAGKLQADKAIELAAVDNDRKRIADDFKARVTALEAETASLAAKISTGYEYRNVPCTVYLGDPEPAQKRIVRDDTGEQVAIEDMTSDEMQRELTTAGAEGGAE